MRSALLRAERLLTSSPRRTLVGILLLALLICGARLASNPPTMLDDQTDNWWPVALSVLHGEGFRSCLPLYFPFCGPGNDLTAMREPIPVFIYAGLAGIRESLWSVAILQVILFLGLLLLIHRMARELAGERAALIAALLWALYLPAIQVIPQVGGDLLAAAACLGAFMAFRRALSEGTLKHWIFAGGLLGCAVLCRTALMALVVPYGLVALFMAPGLPMQRRIIRSIVYGAAFAVVLAPWMVRNRQVFGQWVVGSTLTGYNLLRHNHHLGTADQYRYIAADEAEPVTHGVLIRHAELTGRENEAQVDQVYRNEGKAVIAAHRADHLKVSLWRAIPLWTNWGVNQAYGEGWGKSDTMMLIEQLFLLAFFLLGLRSLGARGLLPAALVAIFCLSHMLVVCRMRYLVPLMPIVIGVAALALDRILPKSTERAA